MKRKIYRKNNYNNTNRKKTGKRVWLSVAIVSILVSVFLAGLIGKMSDGFQKDPADWQLRDRNENNLIAADALLEEFDNGNGFTVKRNDDGTLTVNGKNESEDPQEIVLGTIELEPGTYTFTTGKDGKNKAATNQYFNMALVNGNTVHTADFGGTITVTTKTTYTVRLTLGGEKSFTYRTLYPTLVTGDKAEGFYE